MPIYQSTTFKYSTSEEMESFLIWKKRDIFIPVFRTPPVIWWRRKSVNWRGGAAAMLTSSGQAATLLAVTNICSAGDHVICASKVYGGTTCLP